MCIKYLWLLHHHPIFINSSTYLLPHFYIWKLFVALLQLYISSKKIPAVRLSVRSGILASAGNLDKGLKSGTVEVCAQITAQRLRSVFSQNHV